MCFKEKWKNKILPSDDVIDVKVEGKSDVDGPIVLCNSDCKYSMISSSSVLIVSKDDWSELRDSNSVVLQALTSLFSISDDIDSIFSSSERVSAIEVKLVTNSI